MDFAKKLLHKYGWKDGDGLGKSVVGSVKPVKASFKFDNAGFGADPASDFTNHWWERVFNEATQNVKINQEENGAVSLALNNQNETVEISTKEYSMKKLKAKRGTQDLGYGNFLQSAVLTSSGGEVENSERILTDDIAVNQFKTLTDDELFRACGGRTAHKGAGHGLKMSGKLLRLELQEKELLAKMLKKNSIEVNKAEIDTILPTKDKKGKRIKSTCGVAIDVEKDPLNKNKKKKMLNSKPTKTFETVDQKLDICNERAHEPVLNEDCETKGNHGDVQHDRKQKKKKSKKDKLNETEKTIESFGTDNEQKDKINKKKRKRATESNNEGFTHKKCKKSKKEKS